MASGFWLNLAGCQSSKDDFDKAPTYANVYDDEASGVRLEVKATPTELNIAEKVKLTIRYNHPEGWRIEPYNIIGDGLKGFRHAMSASSEFVTDADNQLMAELSIELEPKDIGEFSVSLPPFYFEKFPNPSWLSAASDPERSVLTPEPIKITVISILQSLEATISDIYDITYIGGRPLYIGGGIALGLVLGCAVLFFTFPISSRGKQVPLSPIEFVMKELDRLEQELSQSGALRLARFYEELNGVFKHFLGEHLRLMMPGETIDESIDRILSLKDMDDKNKRLVREFSEISNIVKFAGYEPNQSICNEALKNVRQLILSQKEVSHANA